MKAGRPRNDDLSRKSDQELIDLYLQEMEYGKRLRETLRIAKEADPFWFFEANDGELSEGRVEVLRRYLKDEDIPRVVDSQLDVLLSKASIKGVSGGNRSSKTISGTIDGIIKSVGELPESLKKYEKTHFEGILRKAHEKFIHGRVTAVDNKQLHRVVLDAWKKWIPRGYLKKGDWDQSYSKEFDILTLYRKGKACASVEFLTNEQKVKSGQGNDLDWAKFDEEPEQAKYKETLMRFGTADRLDIEIDWTPTEGLTWATDLFHDGIFMDEQGNKQEMKDTVLYKLTTVCNSYVDLKTIVKIMDEYSKVSSYEEMKMRLLGEAISLSGLVYGNLFHEKLHVIPPFYEFLDKEKQREYQVHTGWDMHLVTPMAGVFMLLDKELNAYVDRCYFRSVDTEDLKRDFWEIVKAYNYRLGWSVVDKSSDSNIMAFGGRNIYQEVARGKKAIPGLMVSQKFEGSIRAGVDEMKKRLKVSELQPNPRLFIVDRPENRPLITSFKTMERDTFADEDNKGPKDRIREGKHHPHAALRYIFQYPLRWKPEVIETYIPNLPPKNITEVAFRERQQIWNEANQVGNENWP